MGRDTLFSTNWFHLDLFKSPSEKRARVYDNMLIRAQRSIRVRGLTDCLHLGQDIYVHLKNFSISGLCQFGKHNINLAQ